MSSKIMDFIATETRGKSFKTFKYSLDAIDNPSFDNKYGEEEKEIRWNNIAETDEAVAAINLSKLAKEISQEKSILTYFLDGSRHAFKVDDIGYEMKTRGGRMPVYPVVAGQIGVGCLKRENKIMKPEKFIGMNVISLPNISNYNSQNGFYEAKLISMNELELLQKTKIKFDRILEYKTASLPNGKKADYENLAIARIQDTMTNAEQEMVAQLVKEDKLNQNNYLIKDGSLEYRVIDKFRNGSKEERDFLNRYNYVIGASKKFNPEACKDNKNKPNPGYIAELKPYHRTPVARYETGFTGAIQFAVWFVRIRSQQHSPSPFDGILKLEKMLVTDEEKKNGIDSEQVNYITANIINERNPVCYGKDTRWANHLYPVFLTETYVKSKYMGKDMFLNLF